MTIIYTESELKKFAKKQLVKDFSCRNRQKLAGNVNERGEKSDYFQSLEDERFAKASYGLITNS